MPRTSVEQYLATFAALEAALPPASTFDNRADPFPPPKEPVLAQCLHCGKRYWTDKMRWEYRLVFQHSAVRELKESDKAPRPLWWCATEQCDGAGFGYDIHEVKE